MHRCVAAAPPCPLRDAACRCPPWQPAVRLARAPAAVADDEAMGPIREDSSELLPTKLELLKKIACLDRGALATSNDRWVAVGRGP